MLGRFTLRVTAFMIVPRPLSRNQAAWRASEDVRVDHGRDAGAERQGRDDLADRADLERLTLPGAPILARATRSGASPCTKPRSRVNISAVTGTRSPVLPRTRTW